MSNKYGILRVSTSEQEFDRQEFYLTNNNIPKENWIELKKTGKGSVSGKKILDELKTLNIQDGDELFMDDQDRLSRDTITSILIIDELNSMGIKITCGNKILDPTDPDCRFEIQLNAALAERERNKISQRTKRTLDAKRARGISGGRPELKKDRIEKAQKLYDSKILSINEICNSVPISRSSFYKYVELDKNKI